MLSTNKVYSFDANIFINLAKEMYPKDIFPSLWEQIWEKIEQGVMTTICVIYDEVQDEVVINTLKKYEPFFLKKIDQLDKFTEIQDVLKSILKSNPEMIDTTKWKSWWDPWLIAYAKVYGFTIVTSEKKRGQRIPNICTQYDVECIWLQDFFRELDIKQ